MSHVQFGQEFQRFTYFQFFREDNYPIYLRIYMPDFNSELYETFQEIGLQELADDEIYKVQDVLSQNSLGRILTVREAGLNAGRQIEQTMESDRYGKESIVPGDGYRVYRYRGVGLIVYSMGAQEWELGCFHTFGQGVQGKIQAKIVLNRYLGWSATNLGILGIWGNCIDEGIVLLNPSKAEGESVYIDIFQKKLLYAGSRKNIKGKFRIIKLDSFANNEGHALKKEELMSSLIKYTTYFEYTGQSVGQRQMLFSLAQMVEGWVAPEENFRPKQNLSA